MNNKSFVLAVLILIGGGAVIANTDLKKATPIDLFARNTFFGTCIRLVNNLGDPGAVFSDSNPIVCSQIRSAGCTVYSLWDNPACTTANGGKQIAFR